MAGNDTGGLCTLRRPDGVGSDGSPGKHDGIGILFAHRAHLGQRALEDREDVLGSGEEVGDRPVLDRHRRILKAQKVFERGLQGAAEQTAQFTVPVHGGDDEPVAQMEVRLPVDGVVLVTPRHVPDRGARHA